MTAPGLWHNREFNLLWTSQALSDLGASVSTLAMPLLVLVLTGSPVQAGLVGTLALVVRLICRLPAGVLADRVNRRRAMIVCDVVRLIALTGLAAAVWTGRAGLPVILAVALVDGVGQTFFSTVEHAALRSIVEPGQLPTAVARNEARNYAAGLAGPPLGGLLFGLGHALPFAGNALTYLASLAGVALIRRPLQAARDEPPAGHAAALAEGLRFVLTNPFLRAVLVIAAPLNFALGGAIFAIIVTLQRHGTEPAVIGLVETIIAVGGLAGAGAAPALQRRLPLAVLVRVICWAAVVLVASSALFTDSVAAAVPIALAVFLGPACNAALFGYQAAITPDRLQGRVVSVILTGAMSAAAAAPLLAGAVVAAWGGPSALLLSAAAVAASAVAATVSPGIRTMRPIEEAAVPA
ncbi:MFS transporter [Jidongwangia harbinensis]|uniref:MFS transporter n=1 Tax=Jidongwangia harbinensis TaxID=2878561 RepID=UPI001CD9D0B1|nr:MFS transporter [Jidongwangia harbinensis]MCA2212141.1 MFS transporter [Jidongwangia harbinensis]